MKKPVKILLILTALVCFSVALYYPISEYVMQKQSVNSMDRLAALRDAGLEAASSATEAPVEDEPEAETETTETPLEMETAQVEVMAAQQTENAVMAVPETTVAAQADTEAQADAEAQAETKAPAETQAQAETERPTETKAQTGTQGQPAASETAAPKEGDSETEAPGKNAPETDASVTAKPETTAEAVSGEPTPEPTATPSPTPSPTPTATPDRRVTTGAKIWADVEKVEFDESKILPQYKELYAINNEMVGWLTVPGTKIDYPVMQTENEDYYLTHDFFHEDNVNGLLILDHNCDAYTPSYNLVVSGHNRWNNTMFSNLTEYYRDKRHRDAHKLIQFDSLMEERTYVVFAAFFAVDYNIYGEGFQYNANIEYSIDATQWLNEVENYKLYDTDVDVKFGDEFLTLTTCNSSRQKNGRFVVVARRVRDGEKFD